jgi:hypothetical protein
MAGLILRDSWPFLFHEPKAPVALAQPLLCSAHVFVVKYFEHAL